MPGRLFIPKPVVGAIKEHLVDAVERSRDGFWSAHEDEDTLTGHLGALLRISNQKVFVEDVEIPAGTWTWGIDYFKFRGRGPKATESLIGADGIFEIKVQSFNRIEKKSLLFQAKTKGVADRDLVVQCARLSTWREAACVVNYSPDGISALPIDEALRLSRGAAGRLEGADLAAFLGDQFLPCLIGDTNLEYDGRSRRLSWRAMSGEFVATRFSVGSRLRFDIKAPTYRGQYHGAAREIHHSELANYRMSATAQEILQLPMSPTLEDLKIARRSLAPAYHMDGRVELDLPEQQLLNRRMQEINVAYDEVLEQIKLRKERGW